MEYYSAIRKDEILPFVTTQMDLERVVLRKISQKKLRTYDFTDMWNITLKLIDTDNNIMVTRGKGLKGGIKGKGGQIYDDGR